MALVALASAAYPQVIKYAYDTLTGGNLDALTFVLCLIIGVTAFRAIVLYLQVVLANRIVLRIAVDLAARDFCPPIGK